MNAQDRHVGAAPRLFDGDQLQIRDLLYATLVASDNDAAHALSRSAGIPKERFIEKMNEKAQALGMRHTVFVEPTGLDAGNRSTVQDLILLLEAVEGNQFMVDAMTRSTYVLTITDADGTTRDERIYATDKLVDSNYLEVKVGKTGFITDSGYCLATKLIGQNDREYYIIVLGSATIDSRFQDVKAIEYYMTNAFTY
jgi:D-alanyl-D-alanine endopeptidase (penicillin-binding protein 7)